MVQRTRDLGGMTFVDLRDRYGLTQLAFNMDSNVELCTQARKLGREFVVKVEGTVRERESKNSRVPTGDIEIDVTTLEVLNAAKTPPFTIEDETDGGDDLRMQYRYLDLRRKPVQTTSSCVTAWASRRGSTSTAWASSTSRRRTLSNPRRKAHATLWCPAA